MAAMMLLPPWMTLHGHGPLLQATLIVLGTFVLEDAATILATMDVQTGHAGLWLALGALYTGIVLGDMGLYGLGALTARVPWTRRWAPSDRIQGGRAWLRANLVRIVFISRFIPGARLPTYTACGFLGAGLGRFTMTAVVATMIWTSLLFSVSLRVGGLLIEHLGAWRWAGMAGFALTIVLMSRLVAHMRNVSA